MIRTNPGDHHWLVGWDHAIDSPESPANRAPLPIGYERAGGDCGLVGCASLDTDDAQPIARQCIRPAGHAGPCRRVSMRDLELAERLTLVSWKPDHLAWALLDHAMAKAMWLDTAHYEGETDQVRRAADLVMSRVRARGLFG